MSAISFWIIKKVPLLLVTHAIKKVFGVKNIAIFERLLESSKWTHITTGGANQWVYEDDPSFVIEINYEGREFVEPWTQIFPDQNTYARDVTLTINGQAIARPLTFISLDGGRYFVPMPKTDTAYEEQYFYWKRDSLEYKLFQRIGDVRYLFGTLDEFAEYCGVHIA